MVPETDEHVQTLTFPKVTTEGFFNIWRKEPLITTRSEGFQQLSTFLDGEPLTLLQRISVAKRVIKILATLHSHEVVQHDLIIDDIQIKKTVNRIQVALDSRPELGYKHRSKADNIKSFGGILGQLLQSLHNDQ